MTAGLAGGVIAFFATSLDGAAGGIAAANGAILAAAAEVADERGARLAAFALHDAIDAPSLPAGARGFGGDRIRFALAVTRAAATARVILFDHVALAPPALLAPRGLRARIVIFAHGSEVGRRMKARWRSALRGADRVATNSDFTLRQMRATLDQEIGEACPLGLPARIEPTRAPPSDDAPRAAREGLALTAADGVEQRLGPEAALIVGRLDAGEREKGHRELIAAMPAIVAERPKAQLVIVGDGSDAADLRGLAAQSSAAGAILFAGRAPDPTLARLYLGCALFAMPSRQEGFGLVHLEAMNAAKPCVACHDDGAADVVIDGETGLLLENPPTPEAVGGAVVTLLSNPERAQRLGRAGWRRLRERFTREAHQARVAAVLRGALDGQPTAPVAQAEPAFPPEEPGA